MDVLTTILTFCAAALGCSTLVGWLLYRKAMRRIKNAEAVKAEAEADGARWERYEKQLDHAAATIDILHKQVERDANRIAELNTALDDKTVQIRGITAELIQTQHQLNDANATIVQQTRDLASERMHKELYRSWMCHKHCTEREPPNDKLAGKDFKQQERELRTNIKNTNTNTRHAKN